MKLKGRYRFCIVLASFLAFTALSCYRFSTSITRRKNCKNGGYCENGMA
jgi:hypothetical protein